MTITIDTAAEEAERLARQAGRAGRDVPGFLREILQRISLLDAESEANVKAKPDASESFFGIWSNRTDITNGVDWVTKEREAWSNRLGRPE